MNTKWLVGTIAVVALLAVVGFRLLPRYTSAGEGLVLDRWTGRVCFGECKPPRPIVRTRAPTDEEIRAFMRRQEDSVKLARLRQLVDSAR